MPCISPCTEYIVVDKGTVYLDNGTVKVGVNLDWGGAISEIIYQGMNLVNKHDDGRLVQVALYDAQEYSDENNYANWGFNPTQAGDKYGHYSSVLEQAVSDNLIYTKSRPLEWNPDDKGGGATQPIQSDVFVEQWVSLDSQLVRIAYKVTHFGAHNHAVASQQIPTAYINQDFFRLITYEGAHPWSGEGAVEIPLPAYPGNYLTFRPTEYWASLVNNDDIGLTMYTVPDFPDWFAWGFPCCGANTFNPVGVTSILADSIIEMTAYLIVGDYQDARDRVYALWQNHGVTTAWEFNQDSTEGWVSWNEMTPFIVSDGTLKTSATGTDPYMGQWAALGIDASVYKRIAIRMKVSAGSVGALYFTTLEDRVWNENKVQYINLAPGTDFAIYLLDMDTVSTWNGYISQIRFDPTNDIGDIEIDYIRMLGNYLYIPLVSKQH